MEDPLVWLGLVALGVGVGAFGTMIGAGGGFILVPILLILYPNDPPELITSISLAVVLFNALSGTFAYVRQRRIDYLAANVFATATIPGAILGALASGLFARSTFDVVFALLIIGVAVFIIARPTAPVVVRHDRRHEVVRQITDAAGDTYVYSYNLAYGMAISLGIGFVASLFGIGGGVVHVPAMVLLLRFPAHIATATSHYVLVITALTGTMVHLLSGQYDHGFERTAALAIGVLAGAQIGARISTRVRPAVLVRLLGVGLVGVSLRLLAGAVL